MGKIAEKDPDQEAFDRAVGALLEELLQLGERRTIGTLGSGDLRPALNRAFYELTSARAYYWAKRRGLPTVMKGMGPDPEDLGFAKACLPNIAQCPGMPWELPIGAWSPDDVAYFVTYACDCVIRTEVNTLEDPDLTEELLDA